MRTIKQFLGIVAIAILVLPFSLGCNSGGGGGGPTAPPPPVPSTSLNILLIYGTAPPSPGSPAGGNLAAEMDFDGQMVAAVDWGAMGTNCAGNCSLLADVLHVADGSHQITFAATAQQATVLKYTILGQVNVSTPSGGRAIQLPTRTVNLRAGQSTTFNITI